jgi:hypothetical protein
MYLDDIDDIIAVREFYLTENDEPNRIVKLSVGKPKAFPNSEGYYCPFQILGAGAENIKYAAGVDAIQALQLAMVMIGATLSFLNEELDGRLRWEGGSEGDFGFPSTIERSE